MSERTTAEIEGIARVEIAAQARLCSSELGRVEDHIKRMNSDTDRLAETIGRLDDQVQALRLDVQTLHQRWSVWRILGQLAGVLIPIASLAVAIAAMSK